MNRIEVRIDTQTDVYEFVKLANEIPDDIFLKDNSGHCVNGKSLLGCLYTLEFDHVYVESKYGMLSNKFSRFIL